MSSGRAVSTVAVLPFAPDALPAPLDRILPADVRERWLAVDRSTRRPEIVAILDGEESWTGAALVTSRTGTASVKVVDAVGDVPETIAAVLDHARSRGAVQVKWEGWSVEPSDAASLGFMPMRAPLAEQVPAGEPGSGFVRWLDGGAIDEPPYYRQTTDFTCGAVVALMAQTQAGVVPVSSFDRAAELALWRGATNFPACEPVGLGVAVQRMWPESDVGVAIDTDRPVMLGHLAQPEQEWRAVLQRSSRDEARELGVPVSADHMPIAEIRGAIESGDRVLLLISLATMQGFDVPHWVLCHAVTPGALVIEDPWSGATTGDTWVDAHLLPISDDALDAMSVLDDQRFRGVVRIGARP
ncbi:MAG: peptidase C39 family protein [Actinomycetota bacterium]